jgi:hypothetical protein
VILETIYSIINGKYLMFILNHKNNAMIEFVHILTGYALKNNDDVWNKKEYNCIDIFLQNTQIDDIWLASSSENKYDINQSKISTIRTHK